MSFTFDGNAKTITTSQSTINVNDLYSRWKDWVLAGNAGFARAFAVIGGESIGGGLTAGVYLFIDNGWSIILTGVSALTVQGNLVRSPDDSSGAALFQSASTVLIRQQVSAVALGYATGGASFTAADVWNYPGGRSLDGSQATSITATQAAAEALADGRYVIDYAASIATQYNADGTVRTVFDLLGDDGVTPAVTAYDAVERSPQ